MQTNEKTIMEMFNDLMRSFNDAPHAEISRLMKGEHIKEHYVPTSSDDRQLADDEMGE